ncbi:MAG: hypothetical protein EA396_13410 [Anaerolineaceae bacterium]|nr:MAG: hypothetical protein EA396_13410 [Anaerolineaceae bacterium]
MTKTTKPPVRPPNGLIAWQMTLGYINAHHSPDARLKLEAYPLKDHIAWAGAVSWGQVGESVRDLPSLPDVLRGLWSEVSRYHRIFDKEAAAVRRPAGYSDTEWLDIPTQDALHRLLWMTLTAFAWADWRLVIVYQPAQTPAQRVQTRLILPSDKRARVGGRGANVVGALRDCFGNAIPIFSEHVGDFSTEEE